MKRRTLAGLSGPGFGGARRGFRAERMSGRQEFRVWLDEFEKEALGKGISQKTIDVALGDVTFDQATANKDRGGQGVFAQSFLQFSDRMANNNRLQAGKAKIQANAATFKRIEKEFGVPAGVLVAFWGLETDFGGFLGNGETIRSVATLAYDCRRPDLFRDQLSRAAEDHRPRRPDARRNARPVCRRARPVPVPADALYRFRPRL